MKNNTLLAFLAVCLWSIASFLAMVPSAQANTVSCTVLTRDMSYGTSDAYTAGEVTLLQQFLMDKGLLYIATPTGYFGNLTTQAVRSYQSNSGLSVTGSVGGEVRTKIQTESCVSTSAYNNTYSYTNTNTNYSTTNTSIPGCYAGYAYSTITGQSCYTTNYTNYGNTNQTIPGCGSGYFYSTITGQLCSTNYYNNTSLYTYAVVPTISSLSPTTGAVGSSVTVYGTGFSYRNNVVHFGSNVINAVSSYNGTSLTFIVPTQNQNCLYSYNCNYNYQTTGYTQNSVSVTNEQGQNSNSIVFNTTGTTNYYGYGAPTISNVNGPTTITAGTSGVWTFTVNDPSNSYLTANVRFGDENTYGYNSLSSQNQQSLYATGQQTVTFTHTYQTSGYYTVVFTVTNASGQQNTSSVTVNVSGNTYGGGYYNQPTISYISPMQGRSGTYITIQGTGFGSYGNTIHFGIGGTANVSSINNGTIMYYTIPYSVSSCDTTTGGTYCSALAMQVVPGTSYPIYITTPSGQTSTTYFTVTSY